jgi:hypothetical protein
VTDLSIFAKAVKAVEGVGLSHLEERKTAEMLKPRFEFAFLALS